MDSQSNMTHSYSSIDDTPDVKPLVELTSKMNEDELLFTISGINVSFANAIRRVILSEIPMVVFRVSPNNKNKCNIISNTCSLNNEIVKHRLSCIPIHIKDVTEFPLKNYIMELNVENNTGTATRVRIDPKANPAMIVTAIAVQNTSVTKGMTPKTVVPAASSTGRTRVTAASTIAS